MGSILPKCWKNKKCPELKNGFGIKVDHFKKNHIKRSSFVRIWDASESGRRWHVWNPDKFGLWIITIHSGKRTFLHLFYTFTLFLSLGLRFSVQLKLDYKIYGQHNFTFFKLDQFYTFRIWAVVSEHLNDNFINELFFFKAFHGTSREQACFSYRPV